MNSIKYLLLTFLCVSLFIQCQEDDDDLMAQGELEIHITDAPSDDANIKGVFVTVSEVRVDGETYSGFEGRQTIDIKAYQNGRTEMLGLADLEADSYSSIALVLDYETDADGNSPGCYVLTQDDQKESLESSDSPSEITLNKSFEVVADATQSLVIDFDLRKAIQYEGSSQDDYSLRSRAMLQTALRVVEEEESGNVEGQCNDNLTSSDKIVVYAYEKGTFDRETEVEAQSSTEVAFSGAVTSAAVDAQGNYQLSFLEEGEYEIIFAAYEDEDNDGSFELTGTLELLVDLGLDLNSVSVGAQSSTTIDVVVTGILPI